MGISVISVSEPHAQVRNLLVIDLCAVQCEHTINRLENNV